MALPPLPHPVDGRAAPPAMNWGVVVYESPEPIPAPPDDDDAVLTPGPPSSLLPPAPVE